MDRPIVFDQEGQERDWDWLITHFGDVNIERAEVAEGVTQVYRVVKLQDVEGPAVQVVHVVDQSGSPLEGVDVARYWPDAPTLPDWPPPTSKWRDRGVFGQTNTEGDIGYGMGYGDYYSLPDDGLSAIWVAATEGQAAPSDLVSGLGMLGDTNHRHLNVSFQLQGVEVTPPPPEPPLPPLLDEQWREVFEKLDRIIALLEAQT